MHRETKARWKEFVPAGASPAVEKALKVKGRLGLKCGKAQGARCWAVAAAFDLSRLWRPALDPFHLPRPWPYQRHKDQQRNRDYDIVQCTADITNSVSYIVPWSFERVLQWLRSQDVTQGLGPNPCPPGPRPTPGTPTLEIQGPDSQTGHLQSVNRETQLPES